MANKMLIDATHAEETRVVVVDGNKVEEFDFESENKRQLAGNIYLAKVTRVEPSLQAAFVDYGGNRHGFQAFSEIQPDYYQIPVADREALMEEERAFAEAMRAQDEAAEASKSKGKRRSGGRKSKAAAHKSDDPVETKDVDSGISGMETIDLSDDAEAEDANVIAESESSALTDQDTDSQADADVDAPQAADGNEPADDAQAEPETAGEDSDGPDEATPQADAGKSDDENEGAATSPDEAGGEDADETSASVKDDPSADDEEDGDQSPDAAAKDDSIESVADEDDSEDIRRPRKPRARRYKIQEVVKVRQVMLVQVVKEERGNKGAALTTYLSLAGRYCVLMPNTARGGGISRKITNAVDRKKLKEIASEIDVPGGAGLIVRTAGAKRTKAEIKRDYEYLQRLWEQIRELTLKSIAPAKIYEEGDLIKRSIRDLYNREIEEVIVEGEAGYRSAKDFMKMIMPSHAKNVKRYEDSLPLFARYQVESYLNSMFNPVVQLKSGGYIVIGVTEALVAIDVNSGRATKEGSIEETALKTNVEAAEEVARQLRLRDLAGLIVIDFIDMDERKNNSTVEKRLKEKLKTDRARIQVGRISGFGLLEMSRQRLRPGMIEATTQPCPSCHGTGLIRSDDNMSLSILRQIEEEGTRRRSREVLVRCPVNIANFLMNQKREHVAQIEARYGLSVRIEGDVHLVSPDFTLEKFKTASRVVPDANAPVVSVDTSIMDMVDSDVAEDAEAVSETPEDDPKPKRKRRRRRRRRGGGNGEASETPEAEALTQAEEGATVPESGDAVEPVEEVVAQVAEEDTDDKPKPKRRRKTRKKAEESEADPESATAEASEPDAPAAEAEQAEEKPKPKRRTRSRKKKDEPVAEAEVATSESEEAAAEPDSTGADPVQAEPEVESAAAEEPAAKPEDSGTSDDLTPSDGLADVASDAGSGDTPVLSEPDPAPAVEPELETMAESPAPEPDKPKRRGWWSLGS
ncbi:MAG: Rne/Rng family ribonuclease [Pseudomonadota bacterium]